jgi:hypothetical protein
MPNLENRRIKQRAITLAANPSTSTLPFISIQSIYCVCAGAEIMATGFPRLSSKE